MKVAAALPASTTGPAIATIKTIGSAPATTCVSDAAIMDKPAVTPSMAPFATPKTSSVVNQITLANIAAMMVSLVVLIKT